MHFTVEFSTRAIKDLKKLQQNIQKQIVNESLKLETQPFQLKNKIKKIKGLNFLCYRLRIDLPTDSFRLFYGIDKDVIYILRIISKKDADKIIKRIKHIDFPPE